MDYDHPPKGALIKPPEPAEMKWLFKAVAPTTIAAAVNMNQPVSVCSPDFDPRAPIQAQGNIGACVAWGYSSGIVAAYNLLAYKQGSSKRAEYPHAGAIYKACRDKRGWKGDTGSYPADACDICLPDHPLLKSHPYVQDAYYEYPQSVWDDGLLSDYLVSHRPIYPTQPDALEQIVYALSQGWLVLKASHWPNAWNRLTRATIPDNTPFSPADPGHLTLIYGYSPGWLYEDNSWDTWWTPDAAVHGNFMRPGSFRSPASYVRPGGPHFEYRVLVPERIANDPVPPKPEPTPDPPKPEPEPPSPPQPSIFGLDGGWKFTRARNITFSPKVKNAESDKVGKAVNKKSGRATFEIK